jgi:hypothetical protein
VVPGGAFAKGAMADVHWGMIYYGRDDPNGGRPLGDEGKVIGQVPQAERTYTYFHTGYSQFNEHQLAIAESTCSQKRELDTPYIEGVTEQIMTVEQAQVFALQRCRTAREVFPVVEKAGDQPTADLLTQRMQLHEKNAWMLRSLLEK